jgi:hypothetical protein
VIQVAPNSTIFVVTKPIRFIGRLKSTVGICRDLLEIEPMDGAYIVFRNRMGTMLRVIFYDGDGFWLCEKTFSKGSLPPWNNTPNGLSEITARELSVLLWRGNLKGANFPELWKKMTE